MDNCKKLQRKIKMAKIRTIIMQILIVVSFFLLWELCSSVGILNEFLFSKPSKIFKLLVIYINNNQIWKHIAISLYETILGIVIGSTAGIFIAILLWYNRRIAKLLEPFMVVLNALPKTALAPIMIIWAGAGVTGIVVVAISILIVITVISTYNYFINVDSEKIKMIQAFKASKLQIFTKLVFPSNLTNIINVIKINIGMSWIGVIVGEFLVSSAGIGYLIMYGGQVFKLDLVMMGVLILAILAYGMYAIVDLIEKYLIKKRGKGI